MDEKTIQRIKKLQALAERGVGGEKTTAQKKLAKLLKDNGINSLDELQKEEYEYTIFSYNGKHEIKLLRQCMYKVMGQHGDTYVGQRIEARDIDVVGHINTRDKAQALELRRRMLKIFNPELSATLVYEYGGFKRVIDCRAYGEPKILKKEVLYEFDLQIECLNPFWREEEETKEDIASWVAAWHFPCVIEKDSTKSMIYGYRAESVIVDCYNEGDVSTGMRIRFTALGTVSNPILLNVDTEEFIQINATMKTGDVIEINTKYGSKGAKLIRDGVETDYFRYIDVDSTFMQLAIGDNMFRYDAASGVNSLEVSIFYSKEFLGV